MKISVCAPSYKRPQKIDTKKYLSFVRYYVDPIEHDEYVSYNQDQAIIKCQDGVQGNLSRVRNYILKEELKENDAVLLIDDDLSGVFYFEKGKRYKVVEEEFLTLIEKYSMLAEELGVKLWGINVNQDKQAYREYTPFSMLSYIGGPFMCFLKGNECFYDERFSLKEDYDMTLQQLLKYRKVLRVNKFFYVCKQSEQVGGCAVYRNIDKEMSQLKLLQQKWGKKIVKEDKANRSHNLKKKKKVPDYNPIIRVPIRGV